MFARLLYDCNLLLTHSEVLSQAIVSIGEREDMSIVESILVQY
jgi:hypothetical protein